MTALFAGALILGVLCLIAWMAAHSLATGSERTDRDPEARFGARGRRVIGGMVGFGMAGMSAQFASIDVSAPLVVVLAVVGAVAGAWWAGSAGAGA